MFIPLFALRGIGVFDFWWWMAANAAVLLTLTAVCDPVWRREIAMDLRECLLQKIGLGVLSAAVLYGVFFAGNIAARTMFSSGAQGIDAIYGFKQGASVARISLLIVLLIGPGEELFWRGFVQRRLAAHRGRWVGMVVACALYTLMHLGSLNPMLILAAVVCGAVWGLLYLRFRSLALNVVSHVLWDAAVFLIFPLE